MKFERDARKTKFVVPNSTGFQVCVAPYRSSCVLQCVAVYCSSLQFVALSCSVVRWAHIWSVQPPAVIILSRKGEKKWGCTKILKNTLKCNKVHSCFTRESTCTVYKSQDGPMNIVLQCVAKYCRVSSYAAVYFSVLQCAIRTVYRSQDRPGNGALQCVAVCYRVLPYVTVCYRVSHVCWSRTPSETAVSLRRIIPCKTEREVIMVELLLSSSLHYRNLSAKQNVHRTRQPAKNCPLRRNIVLQCVAVCCSELQCVTVRFTFQISSGVGLVLPNNCNTLHYTATHCHTLLHTTTHDIPSWCKFCSPCQHISSEGCEKECPVGDVKESICGTCQGFFQILVHLPRRESVHSRKTAFFFCKITVSVCTIEIMIQPPFWRQLMMMIADWRGLTDTFSVVGLKFVVKIHYFIQFRIHVLCKLWGGGVISPMQAVKCTQIHTYPHTYKHIICLSNTHIYITRASRGAHAQYTHIHKRTHFSKVYTKIMFWFACIISKLLIN